VSKLGLLGAMKNPLVLRPSEYTAMLIQQIRQYGPDIRGKNT
jgi:hypothetical protein